MLFRLRRNKITMSVHPYFEEFESVKAAALMGIWETLIIGKSGMYSNRKETYLSVRMSPVENSDKFNLIITTDNNVQIDLYNAIFFHKELKDIWDGKENIPNNSNVPNLENS